MRILVCGGRDYRDEQAAHAALDAAHRKSEITLIIEGGCRTEDRETGGIYGADYFAYTWALSREIACVTVPAKWKKYGKSAGPKRNTNMLDDWRPEGVIAFPGRRGTIDMVSKAEAAGVKVWKPQG